MALSKYKNTKLVNELNRQLRNVGKAISDFEKLETLDALIAAKVATKNCSATIDRAIVDYWEEHRTSAPKKKAAKKEVATKKAKKKKT